MRLCASVMGGQEKKRVNICGNDKEDREDEKEENVDK